MNNEVETSIVIRALNESKHLDKLFYGLQSQDYKRYEVIFVDSGSSDGSELIAEKYGCRIVKIKKEDFSFGRALNIGCENAKGDYLVFISAHVYPTHKEWLSNLINPFKENHRTGLVYGKQTGDIRTKFSEQQIFNKWFPAGCIKDQQDVFCNNANCAIKKALWREFPYDESLTGLEDLDFAKKLKKKGHTICYASDAEIVHIHEESFSQTMNRYMREALAMKKIEPSFNFTFIYFMKSFFINIFSDYKEAIKQKLFLKNFVEIFKFRLAQNYGTLLGFKKKSEVSGSLFNKFYGYNRSSTKSKSDDNLSLIEYDK